MHHPTDRVATRELLFPISSKGYFITHRPTDRIAHNTAFITPALAGKENCLMGEPWRGGGGGSIRIPIAPSADAAMKIHLAPG